MNNRPLAVNADFARQVAFVSSQLDVSERYVAGLIQSIIARHPNLTSQQTSQSAGSEKLVEAAILEFHTKRRQLAECLKYIVEAAVLGQSGVKEFVAESSSAAAGGGRTVYEQLELFVRQEIVAGRTTQTASGAGGSLVQRSTAGQGEFTAKLLKEIDRLGETIQKVQVARQNARSDTVGPSQSQGPQTISCPTVSHTNTLSIQLVPSAPTFSPPDSTLSKPNAKPSAASSSHSADSATSPPPSFSK